MAEGIRKGSKVKFRIGRGEFTGKVVELDGATATVKRDTDAKEIKRAVKVLEAV